MENISLSDEELLSRNAEDEILARYKPMVVAIASDYGDGKSYAERADLIEEGMIAVFMAMKHFDPTVGASFKTYARKCVINRLNTESKAQDSIRAKETEENEYTQSVDEESPESIILERERFNEAVSKASKDLSDMELLVLSGVLRYGSYKAAAKSLSIDEKAVDNAMQRVRRKLRAIF